MTNYRSYLIFIFISLNFIFISTNIFASAREAKVKKETSQLYSKPQIKSPPLQELKRGESVRIGNKVVQGWVKGFVLLNGKRSSNIGYLRVQDLSLVSSPASTKRKLQKEKVVEEVQEEEKKNISRSKRDSEETKMYFGFVMPFNFYSLKPLEEYLLLSDAGVSKLKFGFGGEFGYRFSSALWGQVRVEYLSLSQKFDASATGGTADAGYSFSGFSVSLAPEYQYFLTEFISLEGSVGIAGILNANVSFSGIDPAKNKVNLGTIFSLIPRLGLRFNLSNSLSFGGGVGYRYTFESDTSSALQLTSVGLSALFLDLGLRLQF